MGILSWLGLARKASPLPAPQVVELFSWTPGRAPWLAGGTYVGTGSVYRVSREDALSVPAVLRGRNLVCSVASMPLGLLGPDRSAVRSPLLEQIDPSVPNVVTLAQTLEDLIFDGVSWWEITGKTFDGRPGTARHLDINAVSHNPPGGPQLYALPSGLSPEGTLWVNGREVPMANVIRFDSPNPPLGTAGARAIRRALKLAAAGEMYADDPEARAYWTPEGDSDPGDADTIRAYLADYAAARRDGSEAYIPAALERKPVINSTPADLQLAQLQQRSDLEIANLMGIDPEDIGVNTTSRTYANAVDRRIDQVNQTLSSWMRAVTDRLSMIDVTPRGYRVEFDLRDFYKADPATRWTTYGVALDKGVLSVEEVRAAEDLPAIPVEGRLRPATKPAPSTPQGVPVPQQNSAVRGTVSLTASGEVVTASFASQAFAASKDKRTVEGMLLPFGVATDDSRRLKFAPGSISWDGSAVGRVKLDREHDLASLLGSATSLSADDSGVMAKFKVARTPAGDEALALAEDGALDGLSAVVEILDGRPDPADEGAYLVTSARLRRATLTADPAFSDARITSVAASAVRTQEGPPMTTATDPAVEPDVQSFTAAVEAFTAAVQTLAGTVPAEQRQQVTPVAQVVEPLVYRLDGLGDSFVRDAWTARNAKYGSRDGEESLARLRKYSEQTAALAQRSALQRFANAGNTTDQAQIIAPQYRPDLYVGQLPQGRPLFESIGTRVTLANATPFKVPVWVGSAGLNATNVEGTGPSTGTITDHTYRTVTPTAQTGEFVVTRELMDSSNPAIDVIAMNAMREEYSQDTEAIIATALAAATDNNVAGQSTEGCYVYAVTGSGNDLAIDGIRLMEAEFPTHRFIAPDRMLASPTGYSALARAVDDIGRPLFPFVGAMNAQGTVGRGGQSLSVDGLNVPNAWSMTSTYDDIVLFNSVDMLVGESPLLEFKFFEKGGPENIYLNIWGYFAFQILRYTGIHACNYTAA